MNLVILGHSLFLSLWLELMVCCTCLVVEVFLSSYFPFFMSHCHLPPPPLFSFPLLLSILAFVDDSGFHNDLWSFDPVHPENAWTLVAGPTNRFDRGVYFLSSFLFWMFCLSWKFRIVGVYNQVGSTGIPGSRHYACGFTTSDGLLWIWSGQGYCPDSSGMPCTPSIFLLLTPL